VTNTKKLTTLALAIITEADPFATRTDLRFLMCENYPKDRAYHRLWAVVFKKALKDEFVRRNSKRAPSPSLF
jgi:hypothetical protein